MRMVFAIKCGLQELATWDVTDGRLRFIDDNRSIGGALVLGEAEQYTFVLQPHNPEFGYRIFIGDVSAESVLKDQGRSDPDAFDDRLVWPASNYFESARGSTRFVLEIRAHAARWTQALCFDVVVVAAKMREEEYEQMSADLQLLSKSLIVDFYGKSKSTYDVMFARRQAVGQTREEELEAIERALPVLDSLVTTIRRRPAAKIKETFGFRKYWGHRRLNPREIAQYTRRCVTRERPVQLMTVHSTESFDIADHRLLKAFLKLLSQRAQACIRVAQNHIQSIETDRHYRDLVVGAQPSLYRKEDVPRIQRLGEAIRRAYEVESLVLRLRSSSFLNQVKSTFEIPCVSLFQGGDEYRRLRGIIFDFLLRHGIWYVGSEFEAITKLTSRLFEEWSFLKFINAFRTAGIQLEPWEEALHSIAHTRLLMDFQRGLQFSGRISNELTLRVRFEPWILGESAAKKGKETLCRVSSEDVAWSPDIVVECLKTGDVSAEPIYVIVLDCKYKKCVSEVDWARTRKYLQIRSTVSRLQVVRQLFLIHPGGEEGIFSEDEAVNFDDAGASCPSDEQAFFRMVVTPKPQHTTDSTNSCVDDVFDRFVNGTLAFLRNRFDGGQ